MYEPVPALRLAFAAGAENPDEILGSPPSLIEILPIGIYACDAEGRLCWFNRRAAALWGRSPRIGDDTERFCGSHMLYGLDGRLIRREETPMAQALRSGEPIDGEEAVVVRPDGSRVIATVHITPLKDGRGIVVGAINCFYDVTAIKEKDRALRDSERRFRELLEALPAAVYTTDAGGRITFYNEAVVKLAGRRPELGDPWYAAWRLYRPDGTPLTREECPMTVALGQDRPVRGVEAVAERPDGTRVPFLAHPTPLHDAAGRLVGIVNMLVDIGQRKEAETQQRILFSELNHRTKNNMQILHALLCAARRETTHPEARAALDEAIQRIGAMAAAQAVLYRASNARAYGARAFLDAVCGSLEQTFDAGITIDRRATDGELGNDTAAPLALILNELVTNAAKHGMSGRDDGVIRVSLVREGGDFLLRVEDDGPGFELASARRRSSGLGLVLGLVRQIGGTFAVERTPGACCTVRFPDTSRPSH